MARVDEPTVPDRPPSATDRPARLPVRYAPRHVIGVGGMGKVYRALDTVLGRDVAIKVIDSSHDEGTGATQRRDRFVREARAAARLAHPNIVAVHDVDPDAGWLVMDLVEGEALRDAIARGPTPAGEVRAIAAQVLSALDAAHANGVIHRDLKPSNLIRDAAGKVTLVDFGVARLVDAELTRTGEALGTPAYMAPEQLRGGDVDARTDLYGLAATLYELVSGERMIAFETPSAAALARVTAACAGEPGLARLIERSLQADPDARPASARDALALLAAPAPAPAPAPRRDRRQRRVAIGVALAAVATTAVVIAVAVWPARASRPADPFAAEMFVLAQRGEHEKANVLLDQYLATHPDDPDARTMRLLAGWWQTGLIDGSPAATAGLRPVQRDMVHGIALFVARQEAKAIAFLEAAERRHGGAIEILYALGEARWHGQMLERGVETLERAFRVDPRWQMALHHVVELRQARGEIAALEPLVEKLRTVDRAAAAALDCQLAIGRRDYVDAERRAAVAVEREQPIPALYVCLLEAQILRGDLDAAERTASLALARWPIDLRQWGGRSIGSELLLYRGKLDEYVASLGPTGHLQQTLTLALWRPSPDLVAPMQSSGGDVRGPPLSPASEILVAHVLGTDATQVYADAPEPEVRAFGAGLAFERGGDLAAAIAEYHRALAVPAKGDIHMLVSYQLARAERARGNAAAAVAACRDVIAPRQYHAYRAALLPDCLLWSDDPAQWKWLSDSWRGSFLHPAVGEARRRLRY